MHQTTMKMLKIGISLPPELYKAAAKRAIQSQRASFSHYVRVVIGEDIAKAKKGNTSK